MRVATGYSLSLDKTGNGISWDHRLVRSVIGVDEYYMPLISLFHVVGNIKPSQTPDCAVCPFCIVFLRIEG